MPIGFGFTGFWRERSLDSQERVVLTFWLPGRFDGERSPGCLNYPGNI